MRTAWTLGVAVLLTGRTASAVTAEVRAETVGQAYQLRGPYGAPVLSFGRLTQTLSLGVHDRSDNPRGYLLTVRARLRIDADFGAACDPATDRCLDEVNRARGAEFSPLFVRRAVDLPWAYLDLERLGGGRVDVRAGRQRLTGFRTDEMLGRNPSLIASRCHPRIFFRKMWQTLHEIGHWQGDIWNRKKTGEEYLVHANISIVRTGESVTNYAA